jgi:Glycosyltransferase 61
MTMRSGRNAFVNKIEELEELNYRKASSAVDNILNAPNDVAICHQRIAKKTSVNLPPVATYIAKDGPVPFKELTNNEKVRVRDVRCTRLKNVSVVGNGLIVDAQNRVLFDQGVHTWRKKNHPMRERNLSLWLETKQHAPPVALEDFGQVSSCEAAVLLAQPGQNIYGHWLLEILPKIAIAREAEIDHLPWLVGSPLPAFAEEMLSCLARQPPQLLCHAPSNERINVEQLYVPSRPGTGRGFSPWLNTVISSLLSKYGKPKNSPRRRLFISRRLWRGKRKLVNYAEVMEVLKRWEFEEVHPEQMSFLEQIALFSQGSVICAVEGSAAHSSIFSAKGTPVVLFCNSHREPRYQHAISSLREQPLHVIYGNDRGNIAESVPDPGADIYIDPGQLEEALRTVLTG